MGKETSLKIPFPSARSCPLVNGAMAQLTEQPHHATWSPAASSS